MFLLLENEPPFCSNPAPSMLFGGPVFLATGLSLAIWPRLGLTLLLLATDDSKMFLAEGRPMRLPPETFSGAFLSLGSWVVKNMWSFNLIVAISLLSSKSLPTNEAISLFENADPVMLKTLCFFSYMNPLIFFFLIKLVWFLFLSLAIKKFQLMQVAITIFMRLRN